MRKLGSAGESSGTAVMGAAIPSCITRAWPPPVSPPACDGSVSRRQHFHTGYRRNYRRHFYRLGLALLTSWWTGDRCPDLGASGKRIAAKRGVFSGSSKALVTRELRLEPVHREIICPRKLSNLPIRSSDEAVRGTCFPTVHPEDVSLSKQTIERAAQDGEF